MDSFKDNILSSFIVFENKEAYRNYPFLQKRRKDAMLEFEKKGFLDTKSENWKYVNIKSLFEKSYAIFPDNKIEPNTVNRKDFFLPDIDSYKIVFINGSYCSWLSETTHNEYDICTLNGAIGKQKPEFEKYFATKINDKEGLDALNLSLATEGAYINIPKNKVVSKPVEIVHLYDENDITLVQPRNLIILGENSQATIIERHININTQKEVFCNSISEVFVDEGAKLYHSKYQSESTKEVWIEKTHITIQKDGFAQFFSLNFGSRYVRNNIVVDLEGSGSEVKLYGLSMLKDQEQVDNYTEIRHLVPNTESFELYRGIYDGNSKGVFNGKLYVEENASGTNGYQQNNNILLSKTAQINSKPQLEILNDKVKCSHGCTIGELDMDSIFYLRQRGIPEQEATALMLFAFCNDVVKDITLPEFKEFIKKEISKKLKVDLNFAI